MNTTGIVTKASSIKDKMQRVTLWIPAESKKIECQLFMPKNIPVIRNSEITIKRAKSVDGIMIVSQFEVTTDVGEPPLNNRREQEMKAPARPQKELIEAGTYRAVCYAVVDMGTHYNAGFDKRQHQLKIQWEIPDLRIKYEKDGNKKEGARVIGSTYTFSMHEKSNLYSHINSWTNRAGEDFDFETLLGMNCLLNVAHKTNKAGTRKYDVVSAVMKVPIGTQETKPENPLVYYSIHEHGKQIPDCVYPWMVEEINKSEEFEMMTHAGDVLTGLSLNGQQNVPGPRKQQAVEDTDGYSRNDDSAIPF